MQTAAPASPPSPTATTTTAPPRQRSVALDRLRGVALVAMLLHHLLDWFSGQAREVLPGWRYFAVTDVAAVAFFCVAGASVALFISARRRRGATRAAVAVDVLRRYGLLVPIGVAIHVAVFRTEYGFGVLEALGVTVVVGAAVAFVVPDRLLPVAAAAVLAAGMWAERATAGHDGWVAEHLLGGTFPVVTYLGFVLVGVAVARSGRLGDRRVVGLAAAVGVLATVALLLAGIEPDRYPGGLDFVVPGLAGTAVALAVCQMRWPSALGGVDGVVRDAGTRALGIFIAHYVIYGLVQRLDLMHSFDVAVALPLAAALTAAICVAAPFVPQPPWSPRTGRRR